MKIYTKTGDNGTTSLVGGKRVSKDSLRLCAYGTADELNSFVGLMRSADTDGQYTEMLNFVQCKIFSLGSYLSTEDDKLYLVSSCLLQEADIERLEQWIDVMQTDLPALKGFILPTGCTLASLSHVCRTITRRLEREMTALKISSPEMTICMSFVNRLSDFFFVLARKINKNAHFDDFLWEK